MRKIIKEVRKLAKLYDVKVRFKRIGGCSGQANYIDNEIILHSGDTLRQHILSTFFHELAHIICYRKGIWKNYHGSSCDVNKIKKMALRVEKYIDKEACKLFALYTKKIKYVPGYLGENDKESRKFLHDYYDSYDETKD